MIRLSSNLTLFFKVFLPTFWIVLFGSTTIAIIISEGRSILPMNHTTEIIVVLCFFFVFLALQYFTIMQLKRVEIDKSHLFVSNYFNSYRYPISDIAEVRKIDLFIFKLLSIRFKNKTKFGTKIICLLKGKSFKDYQSQFPNNLPLR